jgi:hypothetical protein
MDRPRDRKTPSVEDRQSPHQREATDPGGFIGRKPEPVAETIPGGPTSPDTPTPEGHREGQSTDDDTVREAGQDR